MRVEYMKSDPIYTYMCSTSIIDCVWRSRAKRITFLEELEAYKVQKGMREVLIPLFSC